MTWRLAAALGVALLTEACASPGQLWNDSATFTGATGALGATLNPSGCNISLPLSGPTSEWNANHMLQPPPAAHRVDSAPVALVIDTTNARGAPIKVDARFTRDGPKTMKGAATVTVDGRSHRLRMPLDPLAAEPDITDALDSASDSTTIRVSVRAPNPHDPSVGTFVGGMSLDVSLLTPRCIGTTQAHP